MANPTVPQPGLVTASFHCTCHILPRLGSSRTFLLHPSFQKAESDLVGVFGRRYTPVPSAAHLTDWPYWRDNRS